jgi:hypothetical protein
MVLQIEWAMFKATCRQRRHTDEMMRGYSGVLCSLSKFVYFGSIPMSKMSANNSSGNLDICDGSLDVGPDFVVIRRFLLDDLNKRIASVRRIVIKDIRPLE